MAGAAGSADDTGNNVRALAGSSGTEGHDRTPPHNLDAETSVLGSMLLSRDAIAEASEIIGPADFYRGAHRTIYEAIRDLYQRGEPVDAVTLADELEHRGTLEDVGGAVAVSDLAARVPTAANALYYARIVAEQALRRRLIDAGTHIARLGYSATENAEEAVDAAENLVYQVAQHGYSSEFVPMKDLLMASFERIEALHESNSAITGLPTGFIDLDELTAGLQPANLFIIAARPAMGKSTLVTNIAANVTVEQRKPAVLFSLEMSQSELVDRLLASEAQVDTKRLRTGRLEEADWPRLSQAMGRLAEAKLFIDDTPGINLMEIRAKCRRLKQKHGLELVILDYLQLMQPHRRAESRVQEVSELSRGLKILAKELEVPVIALSQLSRKPEDRTDRRPQLADLRESGCLTGDSRVTLASGETAPISSLVGTEPEVVALDGWHLTTVSAARVWRTGRTFVSRLRLSSGRTIRATDNHKFRKVDGWWPLEDLQPGTRIAVPRTYPDTPNDSWESPRGRFAPSRAVLRSSAEILEDTELKALAGADVHWDTVVSVEPDGVEDVYDMSVPGARNFVANDIVVHNSIEQDSDVVAFIYRDEVYDQDSEAKGEAELIIAKHRNGPVGTVHLSFLGHHSRFANMARTSSL